jgi:hypothetical protein
MAKKNKMFVCPKKLPQIKSKVPKKLIFSTSDEM